MLSSGKERRFENARCGTSTVLMYSPFPRGGHPRYTRDLCGSLEDALAKNPQANVELITSTNLEHDYRDGVVYCVHLVLPPLPEGRAEARLVRLARRIGHLCVRDIKLLAFVFSRSDIVAVHFQEVHTFTAWAVFSLIRSSGRTVIATVHNVSPHSFNSKLLFVARFFLRRAYRAANHLIVHSEHNKSSLIQIAKLNSTHQRVSVTPHAFWDSSGKLTEFNDFYERLRRNDKLLFFGAIRENKGLHLLLEAALLGKLEGHALTIAGLPVDQVYYTNIVVPLVHKVRSVGVQVELRSEYIAEDEVDHLVSSHKAMVLPYLSTFDAQSGAALLALSNSIPIISTAAGGLQDLLDLEGMAIEIRSETPTAVALAIKEFNDLTSRESWLLNAFRTVETSRRALSWERMASSTLAIYRVAGVELGAGLTAERQDDQ